MAVMVLGAGTPPALGPSGDGACARPRGVPAPSDTMRGPPRRCSGWEWLRAAGVVGQPRSAAVQRRAATCTRLGLIPYRCTTPGLASYVPAAESKKSRRSTDERSRKGIAASLLSGPGCRSRCYRCSDRVIDVLFVDGDRANASADGPSSVVKCHEAVTASAFGRHPGGDLGLQRHLIGDAPGQTLAAQHRPLQLGHVQPAAMSRGVMPLQLRQQPPRFGRGERLIERGRGDGYSADRSPARCARPAGTAVDQIADGVGEVDGGAPLGDGDVAPPR